MQENTNQRYSQNVSSPMKPNTYLKRTSRISHLFCFSPPPFFKTISNIFYLNHLKAICPHPLFCNDYIKTKVTFLRNQNSFSVSCGVLKCEEGSLPLLFHNECWTLFLSLFTSANCWDLVRYLTTKTLSEKKDPRTPSHFHKMLLQT